MATSTQTILVEYSFQDNLKYEISYSEILIKLRGKNLVIYYQEVFKNLPTMSEMIEFIGKFENYDRFIPLELIEILSKIKNAKCEIVEKNQLKKKISYFTKKSLENVHTFLKSINFEIQEFETFFKRVKTFLNNKDFHFPKQNKNEQSIRKIIKANNEQPAEKLTLIQNKMNDLSNRSKSYSDTFN